MRTSGSRPGESAAERGNANYCKHSEGGSLGILQFTGTAGLGLVHLGGIADGVWLEGRSDLVAYATAFDRLRTLTHTPAQSALHLRGLAGL